MVIDDVAAVERFAVNAPSAVAHAAVASVVAVSIATVLSPSSALVLLGGLVLAGVVVPGIAVVASTRANAALGAGDRTRRALLHTVVRSGGELATSPRLAELGERLAALQRTRAGLARRVATVRGLVAAATLAIAGGTVVMLAVRSVDASRAHAIHPTTVAVVALAAMACFEVAGAVGTVAVDLVGDLDAAARLDAVLDGHPTWPDGTVGEAHGPLRLTDVAIGLGEVPLATGLDLALEPGARLAVVGPSGAGKSTLVDLLFRFTPQCDGAVSLDDAPYDDLTGSAVRAVVGGVDQEPHCFAASVRANVVLARHGATDDEVRAALEEACLGHLAQDLDEVLGEGGRALSGGERRRLGLARLALAAPPVVVLDEPTEGLDAATATRCLDALDAWAGSRPVVLVSHRRADRRLATAELALGSAVLAEDEA